MKAFNVEYTKKVGGTGIITVKANDEKQANAKLIAEAPELLEALIDCLEWMKKVNTSDEGDQAFQRAETAIKKATE